MNRRHLMLGVVFTITVAWSAYLLSEGDEEVVAAASRPSPPGAAAANSSRSASPPSLALLSSSPAAGVEADVLELGVRPAAPAHPRNLFGEYSFEPPKPKAPPPAPEPPHAPPLPFLYVGRLVVAGQTTYFLNSGGEPLNMILGANSAGFKLVEADERQLVFLHEPTGQRVTLLIKPSS